jgi:hypothetical protein
MVRRILFGAAIAALPVSAHAQQAWGDDGGCARVAGDPSNTDLVFILWPDRIERWESTCRITGFDGDLNTQSVIETECNGEGETWTQSYGMAPVGDDLYTIWPVDAPEYITELRLCE